MAWKVRVAVLRIQVHAGFTAIGALWRPATQRYNRAMTRYDVAIVGATRVMLLPESTRQELELAGQVAFASPEVAMTVPVSPLPTKPVTLKRGT